MKFHNRTDINVHCTFGLVKRDLWGLGAESWFVVASYAFAKMIPIRIEKTKKTMMHSWRRMQSFNLEVIAYMRI